MCMCMPAGSLKRENWAGDLLPGKSRRPLDPSSGCDYGARDFAEVEARMCRWAECGYVEVGTDCNGFELMRVLSLFRVADVYFQCYLICFVSTK